MKYIVFATTLLFSSLPAMAADDGLLLRLPPPEQEYHTQLFDYALNYTNQGESYVWHSYGGDGTITAEAPFVSKSKATCRNFTESYTIGGMKGARSGIACKRGGEEGWCVLRPTDALTCAMERSPLLPGVPALGVSGPSLSAPPAGGIGNVGAPNMPSSPGVSPDVDMGGPSRSKPGEPVADTVTGTAGGAAGPATSGAINWFKDTFR